MKILLVDDSKVIRRMQENQLGELGVTDIIHANDGEEALNILAANMPVDIVLLDWNMPVMDGYTCLQTIRANDDYKDVRVVMCTSESEKGSVLEAIKAGANNYIVKPFTVDILKDKLNL